MSVVTQQELTVAWQKADGATSYNVSYNGTGTGGPKLLPFDTNQAMLSSLLPGTTYKIQVTAVNDAGKSFPSEKLDITTRKA